MNGNPLNMLNSVFQMMKGGMNPQSMMQMMGVNPTEMGKKVLQSAEYRDMQEKFKGTSEEEQKKYVMEEFRKAGVDINMFMQMLGIKR